MIMTWVLWLCSIWLWVLFDSDKPKWSDNAIFWKKCVFVAVEFSSNRLLCVNGKVFILKTILLLFEWYQKWSWKKLKEKQIYNPVPIKLKEKTHKFWEENVYFCELKIWRVCLISTETSGGWVWYLLGKLQVREFKKMREKKKIKENKKKQEEKKERKTKFFNFRWNSKNIKDIINRRPD